MTKTIVYFTIMAGLLSSINASAAYWECTGKYVKAGFGQAGTDLLLIVGETKNGIRTELLRTQVKNEDIKFNNYGPHLRNVMAVEVGNYHYGVKLDIAAGTFHVAFKNGTVISDSTMRCSYVTAE